MALHLGCCRNPQNDAQNNLILPNASFHTFHTTDTYSVKTVTLYVEAADRELMNHSKETFGVSAQIVF